MDNIQALRAIAALLVVWIHWGGVCQEAFPKVVCPLILDNSFGGVGVDIFFIISGFVISLTVAKRHSGSVDFFLARIARIAPLYLVFMFYEIVRHAGLYSLKSIWNGFFYLPVFDFGAYTTPPVTVGWTLSFEMWFYLAFALFLIKLRPRQVAVVLPAFFLGSSLVAIFYTGSWFLPHFLFHPLVLEFALGCIIYQTRGWFRGPISYVFVVLGILGLVLSWPYVAVIDAPDKELGAGIAVAWARVLIWGVPCALLVAGLVGLEQSRGIVLPRFLVSMGAISYAMYLTHITVLSGMERIVRLLPSPLVGGIILYLTCIAVAWVVHVYVERPLTVRAQQLAKRIALWRSSRRESVGVLVVPES